MIKIDNDKVLLLHQLLIEETGGEPSLRDTNLLDSCIQQIYQTFDGEELYKSKEEKAARLGFSLISNHAFVDGNKRIGMFMMLTFLEANGVKTNFTNDEIVDIGMRIASSKMSYEELLENVKSHIMIS
ncbi:MAG: type II toxin-antitoxin system death-on-curing family toxin [Lachnospiraceae bacterium]|nr:type II toxin-antitoxin system death-on-curing family toxin [Lachnospiraceae bacterium]